MAEVPSLYESLGKRIEPTQTTKLPHSVNPSVLAGGNGLDRKGNESPEQTDITPKTPATARKGTRQGTKYKEGLICAQCGKKVKTLSDLKKHLAGHRLPFQCLFPLCKRGSKGFATQGDLNQHYKSVHNATPPSSRSFKCFAHGCSRSAKIWPRLGPFKQHLRQKHPNDDPDKLLKSSNDWYNQEHPSDPVHSKGFKCFAHGCSRSTKTWPRIDSFKQHLRDKHPDDDPDKLLRKSNEWCNQEYPSSPTQSHVVQNELPSEKRTVPKEITKRAKRDSGYDSSSDTSTHDLELSPLIHKLTKLKNRYREQQAHPPHTQRETKDALASPQDTSEYNQSMFGKTPYMTESSTSDSERAVASWRILENRRGQQGPQPLISSDGELSFMGSTDSDDLAEDWEANLDPVLRLLRTKLITELIDIYMKTDYRDENVQCRPHTTVTTSNSSPGSWKGSSSNTYVGTNSKPSNATSSSKHQRSSGEASDEDEESREFPGRKRYRGTTTSISLDGRLLACPYCKFDPMRYSEQNLSEKNYRGCSSIYLTTISRLKQHLYRVHKRPDNYCRSCFDTFETEELLSEHNRSRPACEVQDPQFEERMTTEQVNLIKRRSVGKTPEEMWFAIFKILFPGTPLPTTPFVDSVSPEAIQRFLDHFFRQARPRLSHLVQRHLGGRLLLESDQQRILDSALESAIAELVRETVPFRENHAIQEEVLVEEVQPRDLEGPAIDTASQVLLPRVTPPTSPVGAGNVLEESHEDSSQSWAFEYLDAGFFEDVEDAFQ